MPLPVAPIHPSSNNPPKLTAPKPIMVAGTPYASAGEAIRQAQLLAQNGQIAPQELAAVITEAQRASGPVSERDESNNDVRAAIMQLMAQQQGQQPRGGMAAA